MPETSYRTVKCLKPARRQIVLLALYGLTLFDVGCQSLTPEPRFAQLPDSYVSGNASETIEDSKTGASTRERRVPAATASVASAVNRDAIVRFQSGESALDLPASDLGVAELEMTYPIEGMESLALDDGLGMLHEADGLTPSRLTPWQGRRQRLRDYAGQFAGNIRSDLGHLYSVDNLPLTLVGLGVGAGLANSNVDAEILEHLQDNISFNQSDEYREFVSEYRFFGEGYYLLPVYAGTALAGKFFADDSVMAARMGAWGDRSFRAIIIGTPPLLVSQYVLGGSRPGETAEGSEWHFLADNNGVSGHSFMGAVPFLTAMRMTEDRPLKAFYFTLSTLPALSRITENGHYPSQALLGWGLAWLVTDSVARTESNPNRNYSVFPVIGRDELGLGFSFRY